MKKIILIIAVVLIFIIIFIIGCTEKPIEEPLKDLQEAKSAEGSVKPSPTDVKCPDGVCDDFEKSNKACPEDCGGSAEQLSKGEKQILPESNVKCPDGVCDDFEMREGVCAEDCKGIEGWGEKTGQPEEEGTIEKPKEEGAQKPPEKITSTYNWLMLGHDSEHSSFSNSTAPNDNNIFFAYNADLSGLKEKNIEKDVNGLVFEHNRLYYLFDKFVYALDIPTGNMVWYSDMGELATGIAGIAIANNILFVSAGKKLSALNIDTGNKLWDYETSGEITPPVVSDKIYFGSKDYYLYAIKTDGKLAWKFKVNSEIHSVPSVSNGKVCFGTENVDFSVYCLDANTGKLLWRHTFSTTSATGGEGGMFHAAPAIYNNIVFIGEEGGKRGIRTSGVQTQPAPSSFYALDINTGDIIWDFKASDWIVTVPAIGYGKVYFTTWDENTYAVNMADGKLIWKAKGRSTPAVADGKVFVGSSDTIYSYDASTGKELWKYQSEDIPSFLVVGDGKLYASFTAEDVVKKYQIVGFGKK